VPPVIRVPKRLILVTAWALVCAVLACNVPGTHPSRPVVEIQAPASGAVVVVNEPVIVSSVAVDMDGPGIYSVELFVEGESIRLDESPSGGLRVFDAAQTWIPDSEGEATVSVVAYREDGTPSAPASITVTVVGLTVDPTQTNTPPSADEGSSPPSASTTTLTSPGVIQGRIVLPSNIRSGPGPFCDILGTADTDDVINLLELSLDDLWYKTDFLGPSRTGWVSVEPVALEGDPDLIPRGDEIGCQGCGDGACNLQETCFDCPVDCGECCGNGICEPDYGEDCGLCEADCGPCCGNGVCEPGRNEDCGTCEADCGACCGNGICEPGRGEDCGSCSADCGSCCGNGLCESGRGENCSTCSSDCGRCCGNGLCEKDRGENCATCSRDCGRCCGNGTCQPGRGEDCESCPEDCGVCDEED
jgi:hypothetical protein